jgi:hypothetical protein
MFYSMSSDVLDNLRILESDHAKTRLLEASAATGVDRNTGRTPIAVLALIWLVGCHVGAPEPETRTWTEDVLLDGGKTIQVKRTVTFNETNSMSGDAYNAVESDATLAFTGELSGLPMWRQPLMALVMYRDKSTEEWVVVAKTSSCEIWERRGRPKPPYWEFRLDEQGWREVPLSQASIGRPANLLHRYQGKLKSEHITIVDRHQLESSSTMDRPYREIWGDPDQYLCGEGNPGK